MSRPDYRRAEAIAAQLQRLRSQRDGLDGRIRRLEQQFKAVLDGEGDGLPDVSPRASPTTERVLELVWENPQAPVPEIGELAFGERSRDNTKRTHNALRTLSRHGLVEKLGRGTWEATDPQALTRCGHCDNCYPRHLGRCAVCGRVPG